MGLGADIVSRGAAFGGARSAVTLVADSNGSETISAASAPRRALALALALGPADDAVGDHCLDLGRGIAELAEHFSRVLAECRRRAAQAWLRACQLDRRGHTLVPILLDNVATVERVRALQCLVDLLHGAGRQSLSLIHISEPTRRTPISY